jgi:hypothetical protein
MGETTVVSESVNRAFESPEHIEIGGLRGKRHRRCGEGGFAVESCSPEDRAG